MKSVDEIWFKRLSEIERPAVLSWLKGDPTVLAEAKRRFLDGETENPYFSYEHIDTDYLLRTEAELKNLAEDMRLEEQSGVVVRAYQAKIEYVLEEMGLLRAAQAGDENRFNELNEHLYGDIDTSLFSAVCRAFSEELATLQENENTEVASAARELAAFIEGVLSRVSGSTEHHFHWHKEERGDIVNAREIQAIFLSRCEDLGLEGWRVKIDTARKVSSITVRPGSKEILIPENRHLPRERAEALAMHEVGVHARRRENGLQTPLKLLGSGLDHYLFAEEGLAKALEIEQYPGALNSALESYFFLSLIRGVDGEERGFRDIFSIAKLFYKSMHASRFEAKPDRRDSYAWGRAMRFFRGTSGQGKGVCLRRHLAYLAGYVQIKKVLDRGEFTKEELYLGKYDPSNKAHLEILASLNIL